MAASRWQVGTVCAGAMLLCCLGAAAQVGSLTFVGDVAGGESGQFIAIPSDGQHVYLYVNGQATENQPIQIVTYSRNSASGGLTEIQRLTNGMGGVEGLGQTGGMMIFSPDGQHLYVSGPTEDAIALFDRDAVTGLLTFGEAFFDGVDGVEGLASVSALAISSDGSHVYARTREGSEESISVLSRDQETGALEFVETIDNTTPGVSGLDNAYSLTVSPDGLNVYVVSGSFFKGENSPSSLTVFSRDAIEGTLTFVQTITSGTLAQYLWVVISHDGRHAYVAVQGSDPDGGVTCFERDTVTGALSQIQHIGFNGLAFMAAISHDDLSVYTSFPLVALSRDPFTGLLAAPQFVENAEFEAAIALTSDNAHLYSVHNTVAPPSLFDRVAIYTRMLEPMTLAGAGVYQEGETLTLTIDGPVDLSRPIKWRKDGTNLHDNAFISGADTATLTISPLLPTHTGYYAALYDDGSKAAAIFGPGYVKVVPFGLSLPIAGVVLPLVVLLGVVGGGCVWWRGRRG